VRTTEPNWDAINSSDNRKRIADAFKNTR
jgi:hypothetical protein